MIFTSIVFVVLLVLSVGAYWATGHQRARLAVLFVASLVFYAWHHWPSIFLLLFTIATNYAAALALERRKSRALLAVIVGLDLAILGWFKYAAFVAETLVSLFAVMGVELPVPTLHPFLPLGISFFTFQVVAYQVDVWRGEVAAERDPLVFAVFKCFYAQLVAGPIVRAVDFLPQLRTRRTFDPAAFQQGLFLVIAGFTLKLAVADVLAQFVVDAFAAPGALSTTRAWTGIYAFAFQLFADFWGYSTIAVGVGLLFGLELPLNFELPYGSASLRDFWRRWHVTLSAWFRDYVYVPLGGNRRRAAVNLVITMAVAGLWHGAGWSFVLWGLANGLWLVVERRLGPWPLPRAVKTLLVFHGVCLCWVLFRAPDLATASAYFGRLLLPPYTHTVVPAVLLQWLIGFALLQPVLDRLIHRRRFVELPVLGQVALVVVMLLFDLAHAGARIDFIYFTF